MKIQRKITQTFILCLSVTFYYNFPDGFDTPDEIMNNNCYIIFLQKWDVSIRRSWNGQALVPEAMLHDLIIKFPAIYKILYGPIFIFQCDNYLHSDLKDRHQSSYFKNMIYYTYSPSMDTSTQIFPLSERLQPISLNVKKSKMRFMRSSCCLSANPPVPSNFCQVLIRTRFCLRVSCSNLIFGFLCGPCRFKRKQAIIFSVSHIYSQAQQSSLLYA